MASIAVRNNNPGNLKDPSTGVFRTFASPQQGEAALESDLTGKVTGNTSTGLKPTSTLSDFAATYAPASDKNDPVTYAANLAKQLGVPVNTPLSALQGRIHDFAGAVAHNEDSSSPAIAKAPIGNLTDKTIPSDGGALAQKIKAKYPQYADIPDDELEKKILAKYPQYADLAAPGNTPAPTAQKEPSEPGLGEKLTKDAGDSIQGVADAATNTLTGKINPISGALQAGGAIASGLGSGVNDLATSIPVVGGVIKGAEGLLGKGVGVLAKTGPGKQVAGAISDFSSAHPEISHDIGSAINIAGALEGGGALKDIAAKGIDAALTGSKDAIYDAVAPKMTAKELGEAAAQRGTKKTGLLRKIEVNKDPYTEGVSKAVKEHVPGFNPRDLSGSINKTQAASKAMGASIRSDLQTQGAGMIYSPAELTGVLNKIEEPISLKGTPFEKQAAPLKKAILKIAEEKGYKVPSLLDVRQEFDSLVKKHYPNLYDRESSPIRSLIRSYSDALTGFTEKRVPTSELKSRLRTQSKLITAVENMAEKASGGATREIGGTAIDRLAGRHPLVSGFIKRAAKALPVGIGLEEGGSIF